MKQRLVRLVAIGLLGTLCLLWCSGCTSESQYRVDYGGQKAFYKDAKDTYRAGESVVFYYDLLATDTDYAFFLDGERLNTLYEDGKGFAVRFTMPAHDVKVTMESHNSMVYTGESGYDTEVTLSYHSYDGGGPVYSVEIADPDVVACEETIEYDKPNHAQLNGAGYDVTFTLTGLKPGQTTATVICDFKGEPTETAYTAVVNESLQIRLEEQVS